MMSLRLAPTNVLRIPIGDEDWIEVRPDISRRQFNELFSALPDDFGQDSVMNLTTATSFTEALFNAFVTGWSAVDEDGNQVPVTPENYQSLSSTSAKLIDAAVSEHFGSLTPDDETATKSKGRGKE